MSDSMVRAATLVVSLIGAGIATGALVVVLRIENAILKERDVMKGWVLAEIRRAIG